MNASDLQQLSAITKTTVSGAVQELGRQRAQPPALEYLLEEGSAAQLLSNRALIFLLHRMYGADEEILKTQLQRLTSMCTRFVEHYGDGPVSVLRAPARINILGEHIDYVSYLPTSSLTFGSREHDMLMLYRASESDRVRGASTLEYAPFAFTLVEGPPFGMSADTEAEWLSYLYLNPAPVPHWANYVKGAAYFARVRFGAQIRRGFDFVVDSFIPPGGSASSSSALVVLAAAAVHEVNGLEIAPIDLARDAARAEWYVGTRGGSMDHITICLATSDKTHAR